MTKQLSILGSTGSIGRQTLDVAQGLGLGVAALTAHRDAARMEEQIRQFQPGLAVLTDEDAARDLKARVRDLPVRVASGPEALVEAATLPECDTVLTAVMGMVGLRPTLAAIEAGKGIALANKETLVCGGELVMAAAKKKGITILPVDSEHSAVFQCLQGCRDKGEIRRLIITASGGPFFGKTREELKNVTAADALKHPTWAMGAKITIDSASMFNKGLELIEAHFLFGVTPENIDIVVHRESIIHSLIEFDDNSVLAQLGVSDMRIPIQYALTYPERYPSPVKELNLAELGTLTFYKPDYETFDCLGICKEAVTRGGLFPAAVNSANEEANRLFREGTIGFLQLGELIRTAFELAPTKKDFTLADIYETDALARARVRSAIRN